jgi:DNA transformation protein
MEMSYRQAPEEIFEDREEALRWGRMAWEAALRSGAPPKKPRAVAKGGKSAAAAKTAKPKATKPKPAPKAATKAATKTAQRPAAKKTGKR